jgi:hypothetical protein
LRISGPCGILGGAASGAIPAAIRGRARRASGRPAPVSQNPKGRPQGRDEPMHDLLTDRYEPAAVEPAVQRHWEEHQTF